MRVLRARYTQHEEGNAAVTALVLLFLLIIIVVILTSMGLTFNTIIKDFTKFFGFIGFRGGING